MRLGQAASLPHRIPESAAALLNSRRAAATTAQFPEHSHGEGVGGGELRDRERGAHVHGRRQHARTDRSTCGPPACVPHPRMRTAADPAAPAPPNRPKPTPAGSLVSRSTLRSDSLRPAEATFLAEGARPKRAAARHRVVEVTMICARGESRAPSVLVPHAFPAHCARPSWWPDHHHPNPRAHVPRPLCCHGLLAAHGSGGMRPPAPPILLLAAQRTMLVVEPMKAASALHTSALREALATCEHELADPRIR